MLRKELASENDNLDRWLISYADFITLLFAFFVVMYSISQVNEGKYKVLSESLVSAFEVIPRSMKPIQVGEVSKSQSPDQRSDADADIFAQDKGVSDPIVDSENLANGTERLVTEKEFSQLQGTLESRLDSLIANRLVDVKSTQDWLEINLKSQLLFESGSDQLGSSAHIVIEEIAGLLKSNRQLILVKGHTDNIPINTERFPSNWSLSAARSVAIVELFHKMGIRPERLSAAGMGEFQPIDDNTTSEGRSSNRRVTIAVSRIKSVPESRVLVESSFDDTGKVGGVNLSGDSSVNSVNKELTEEQLEEKFDIVRLPGGGLLIRGLKKSDDNKNP